MLKKILFLPAKVSFPINDANSVLEVALQNKIPLDHSCGGMGSCTTCRIVVESPIDLLPPKSALELEITDSRGFSERERLACQLDPVPGLVVRIPAAPPKSKT